MMEDFDQELLDFYESHCASTDGVVVTQFFYPDGTFASAVFSCLKAAHDWAEELHREEEGAIVFIPYIIDMPEYGNVPKNTMS